MQRNILIIGPTQTGKTTLVHAFGHHFLSKKFEEDRIEAMPIQSQRTNTSLYNFENGETLCFIDTPGLQLRKVAENMEEIEQILDDIVAALIEVGNLHAVILVANPMTRKDLFWKEYLPKLLLILPDKVKEKFYVVCTKNSGEVEPETRLSIEEIIHFQLDDKKWFSMDNKCMKPYSSFKEEYREVFEDHWSIGKLVFSDIAAQIDYLEPMSTSYLIAYQEEKKIIRDLIENLNIERENLFKKIREKDRFQTPFQTIVPAIHQEILPDKTCWACKDCKKRCSTRNPFTLIMRYLGNFFPWNRICHYRPFRWLFRCSQCYCSLTKHTEANISISYTPMEEESLELDVLIRQYLMDYITEINKVIRGKFLSCMIDSYHNALSNLSKDVMENESCKFKRMLMIKAIKTEKRILAEILQEM